MDWSPPLASKPSNNINEITPASGKSDHQQWPEGEGPVWRVEPSIPDIPKGIARRDTSMAARYKSHESRAHGVAG